LENMFKKWLRSTGEQEVSGEQYAHGQERPATGRLNAAAFERENLGSRG